MARHGARELEHEGMVPPVLQSVRFERGRWKPAAALKWLREGGIHPIKAVDATPNWLRYRIRNPRHGARYVTKTDDASGIQLLGMYAGGR
jgi:hypothetical protein